MLPSNTDRANSSDAQQGPSSDFAAVRVLENNQTMEFSTELARIVSRALSYPHSGVRHTAHEICRCIVDDLDTREAILSVQPPQADEVFEKLADAERAYRKSPSHECEILELERLGPTIVGVLSDGRKMALTIPGGTTLGTLGRERLDAIGKEVFLAYGSILQVTMQLRAFHTFPYAIAVLRPDESPRRGTRYIVRANDVLSGICQCSPAELEKRSLDDLMTEIVSLKQPSQSLVRLNVDKITRNPDGPYELAVLEKGALPNSSDVIYHFDTRVEHVLIFIRRYLQTKVNHNSIPEYMENVCKVIQQTLAIHGCMICQRAAEDHYLVDLFPKSGITNHAKRLCRSIGKIEVGLWRQMLDSSSTHLYVSNVANLADYPGYEPCYKREKSELIIKLSHAGEDLGLIDLTSDRVDGIPNQIQEVARDLALDVSKALHTPVLRRLKRRIGKSFHTDLTALDSAESAMVEILANLFEVQGSKALACWYEADHKNGLLHLKACSSKDSEKIIMDALKAKPFRLLKSPRAECGLSVMSYLKNKPVVTPVSEKPGRGSAPGRYYRNLTGGNSVMAIPMRGKAVDGVLYVESVQRQAFTEADLDELQIAAEFLDLWVNDRKRFNRDIAVAQFFRSNAFRYFHIHDMARRAEQLRSVRAQNKLLRNLLDEFTAAQKNFGKGVVSLRDAVASVKRAVKDHSTDLSRATRFAAVVNDVQLPESIVIALKQIILNAFMAPDGGDEGGLSVRVKYEVSDKLVRIIVENNARQIPETICTKLGSEPIDSSKSRGLGGSIFFCSMMLFPAGSIHYRNLPPGQEMKVRAVISVSLD